VTLPQLRSPAALQHFQSDELEMMDSVESDTSYDSPICCQACQSGSAETRLAATDGAAELSTIEIIVA
jgi:hypothetical protein